jgi:SAM-dependent methyltransferase
MRFGSRLILLKRILRPRNLRRYILHIALKGHNVECPCCGSTYLTFLPAGILKRANATCIKCGSLERHRNLWLFFLANAQLLEKQIKLLHAAPEKIFYKKFSADKNIDYYPIDLHPADYNYGTKTMEMDLTDLKYSDNFFDAIICNHVLEHIPDDRKAMKEIYRVLKPDGWAIINVPIKPEMSYTIEDPTIDDPQKQLKLFGQPDHVRIYGKDYTDRLHCCGFRVEVIQYPLQFDSNQQFYYGLNKNELIYLCRK